MGFNFAKPNKTFTASTEIKPITTFELDKYRMLNSSLLYDMERQVEDKTLIEVRKHFEITEKSLLYLFIENIEEGSLLEKGIDKFSLINKDDFGSDEEYRASVRKGKRKVS